MKALATADEQRDRTAVPEQARGVANMVTDRLEQLMMCQPATNTEDEAAMAVNSDSESSVETRAPRRGREREKTKRKSYRRAAAPSNSPSPTRSTRGPYQSRTRSSSRARVKLKPHEVNPTKCKLCKKYGGNGFAHGPPNKVPHAKCNYNEEWDGWRPNYVCKRMNIAYKKRDECEE